MLAAGAGIAVALPSALAAKQRRAGPAGQAAHAIGRRYRHGRRRRADDTAALQSALDATFNGDRGILTIEPGDYRRDEDAPHRVRGRPGAITRLAGIAAYGARIVSEIAGGQNVIDIVGRAAVALC